MVSIGTWVLLAALVLAAVLTLVADGRAARRHQTHRDFEDQGPAGASRGDRLGAPARKSDWAAFERDFWSYVDRRRPSSGARRAGEPVDE